MKEVEVIRSNPSKDTTSAFQNRSKTISTRDLPMGWLTAVNQPNSHDKEKQFVQGVERTSENPVQLDYSNALNVVRQDTFIVFVQNVKCELEKKEREDVISKINVPTVWCSGMVVVLKLNNQVRICVDLTKLNCYIKRERHILPSVDHILAQIGDAKFFSQLDTNSVFWQIELSPNLSKDVGMV